MKVQELMQATRQQILDYLRRQGRTTVKELSQLLGLTSTGIRQHLTVLQRDGLVEAHEERGHVGRPALVYQLTSKGDALYPKRYDQLANCLLAEIRNVAGADRLQAVLKRAAARLAEPYIERVIDKPLGERVIETSKILNETGCLAEVVNDNGEWLIRQFTCPFPNVAREHSSVCALDVEYIRLLVGTDARLSQSLLRGDSCCAFRIRNASVPHAS
jgi:predicted ArsR family transcriptional regulator